MKTTARIGVLVALLLAIVGCAAFGIDEKTVEKDWIAAESATYEAIAPLFLELLESECGPSDLAQSTLRNLVGDWAFRITAHGGSVTELVALPVTPEATPTK